MADSLDRFRNNPQDAEAIREKLRREYSNYLPISSRIDEEFADPETAIERSIASESGSVDYVFPQTLQTEGTSDFGPYMQISCYRYQRGYRSLTEIGQTKPKERYYTIKLPLPQTITQEYSADTDQFSGNVIFDVAQGATEGTGDIISAVFGAAGATAASALKAGLQRFLAGAGGATFQTLANAAGAQRNLVSATTGLTLNPRYEVVFNSMQIRQHSFDFNLVPKDAQEAEIIRELTRRLRKSAHPTPVGGTELKIGYAYPDEFIITFHGSDGTRLRDIPFIPDCLIRNLGITHTTGRLHLDDSPVATRVSIQFQELHTLDRTELERLESK